jgi:hypothetical protein
LTCKHVTIRLVDISKTGAADNYSSLTIRMYQIFVIMVLIMVIIMFAFVLVSPGSC